MVKILGIGDLVVTALFLASAFNIDIPLDMLFFIAIAFFLKGIIFLFDIGSIFDVIAAILLVSTVFLNVPAIILFVAAILIGIKGLMSLAA